MSLLSYIYEDRRNSIYLHTVNNISIYNRNMPVNKKIIKIDKDKYEKLKKDFTYTLDLYISDNEYYVIGTFEDLKAVGIDPGVPFV